MDVAPLRIECIDISHVQGTDVVASLVVFEDGLPKRSDYRRFAIRDRPGDDVASIAEVVRRRFTHGANQGRRDAARIRPRRSGGDTAPAAPAGRWPGDRDRRGRPSRATGAASTRRPAGRAGSPTRRSCWWSTAARRRSTPRRPSSPSWASSTSRSAGWPSGWRRSGCPAQDEPIIFPRTSEALYLLQRLRDEAHRFAITYHRAKRSKSMTVSALDNVPGLGEVRRKALVRHFGSVAALRRADVEDITRRCPGSAAAPPRRWSPRWPRRRAGGRRPRSGRRGAAIEAPQQPARYRYRRRARRYAPIGRRVGDVGPRERTEMSEARDGRVTGTATPARTAARTASDGRDPGRHRLRAVRRRAVDRRQVPGGPGLVRGRQPAARN